MKTKVCTLCKKEKPVEEFAIHTKFKDKRNSRCKKCKNAEAKAFYAKHKDDILTRQRKYKSWRGTKYGLSKEDYARLVEEQGGCCAVCKKSSDELVIDHCHSKGEVRGLLCRQCNLCIGHAQDSSETLRRAADYLERSWETSLNQEKVSG